MTERSTTYLSGLPIAVDVQIVSMDGATEVAEEVEILVELFDANMDPTTPGSGFGCAETGNGTEITNTAQDKLIFKTGANGDAQLTVTDEAGSSESTITLMFTLLGYKGGSVYHEIVTFDDA